MSRTELADPPNHFPLGSITSRDILALEQTEKKDIARNVTYKNGREQTPIRSEPAEVIGRVAAVSSSFVFSRYLTLSCP
jgi:hypothetical protein